MLKILVIEDDRLTADYIAKGFKERQHCVDLAADGHEGLMLATGSEYDVLIIDRMLPKLDGLSLLKTLRESGVQTPALFLTALDSTENKVKGFDAGGDDYLVKPFAFAELLARVQSLAKRPAAKTEETILHSGDLTMDLVRREVTRTHDTIELQPTEFKLLEFMLRHKGQLVTRTMLLESVWGFHFEPKTSIIETHISRLRAKIDKGRNQELIQTVRGAGYRLDDY